MVLKGDTVTSNRIDSRQRIIRPRKQTLGSLVNDNENDIVGRRAAGARASRLAFLRLQDGTSESHQ